MTADDVRHLILEEFRLVQDQISDLQRGVDDGFKEVTDRLSRLERGIAELRQQRLGL